MLCGPELCVTFLQHTTRAQIHNAKMKKVPVQCSIACRLPKAGCSSSMLLSLPEVRSIRVFIRKFHFRKGSLREKEKRHRYSFPETKSVGKIILHCPRAKTTLPESRLRYLHVARRRPPPPHQLVDDPREGCPWSSLPHVALRSHRMPRQRLETDTSRYPASLPARGETPPSSFTLLATALTAHISIRVV